MHDLLKFINKFHIAVVWWRHVLNWDFVTMGWEKKSIFLPFIVRFTVKYRRISHCFLNSFQYLWVVYLLQYVCFKTPLEACRYLDFCRFGTGIGIFFKYFWKILHSISTSHSYNFSFLFYSITIFHPFLTFHSCYSPFNFHFHCSRWLLSWWSKQHFVEFVTTF